jgi:hypothetical protein
MTRLLRAGALTAVVDFCFATTQSLVLNHSWARVWQGVAGTLLGPAALQGGTRTALIGVAMHCGVAFGWSAVFLALVTGSARLRAVLAGRFGPLKVAAVYGPCIWMVMSLVVIPLLVHRPPVLSGRWLFQLFGHIPFVGLPIAWGIRHADG